MVWKLASGNILTDACKTGSHSERFEPIHRQALSNIFYTPLEFIPYSVFRFFKDIPPTNKLLVLGTQLADISVA